MTIKTLSAVLCISCTSWAGGSVIGNGAGIVENNFQFAYLSLTTTVAECLQQQKCEMSPAELKALTSMKEVLDLNRSNEKRLQFVSEKDHPDFFNTGEGQVHRIAKTGLTPVDPIFINLDLLYSAEGRPAFDLSTAVSILAHEVGHQSGELDHAKLDIIGSKLKKVTLEKVRTHDVEVGPTNERVEVSIINQTFPYRTSEVTASWQNVGSVLVTKALMDQIHCRKNGATLASVEIDNGHYTKIFSQPEFAVGFAAWVHITCYSPATESFSSETKGIEAIFNKKLQFQLISVKDL